MYSLFRSLADLLLTLLEWAMLFRAIFSWFPQMQRNQLNQILYQITEPFIAPIRSLLNKIPALQGFPLDISFFLTYMILIGIHSAL